MKCPVWFAVVMLLVMFPVFAIGFVTSVFLRTLQVSHQAALEFVSWVADQQ